MSTVVGAPDTGISVGLQQAPPDAELGHVHLREASDTTGVAAGVAAGADSQLLNSLPRLAARLQARHPSASPAMVQSSIDDALGAFRTVRVRHFLPILIERTASEALRTAARSADGAASTSPGNGGVDP